MRHHRRRRHDRPHDAPDGILPTLDANTLALFVPPPSLDADVSMVRATVRKWFPELVHVDASDGGMPKEEDISLAAIFWCALHASWKLRWSAMVVVVLLSFVVAALEASVPFSIKIAVDHIADLAERDQDARSGAAASDVVNDTVSRVRSLSAHQSYFTLEPLPWSMGYPFFMVALAVVVVPLTRSGIRSLQSTLCTRWVSDLVNRRFKAATLAHFFALPHVWHEKVPTGAVTSDLDGCDTVGTLISGIMGSRWLGSVAQIISVVSTILMVCPQVWFILLPPLPLYFFVARWSIHRRREVWHVSGDVSKVSRAQLVDQVSKWNLVKDFGGGDRAVASMAGALEARQSLALRGAVEGFVMVQLTNVITHSLRAAVLVYGWLTWAGWLPSHATVSLGTISLLMSNVRMLLVPLRTLASNEGSITRNLMRLRPVFRLLLSRDVLADHPTKAQDAPPLTRAITLDGVSYRYEGVGRATAKAAVCGTWALRDVCVCIPRGATVGIVGRSGAGKSTLVSLLLRQRDPTHGSVLWDDVPMPWLRRSSRIQRIVPVPQITTLFSVSVAENIAYGRPNATREDIQRAAKRANAHDFIMQRLSQGYDSRVGENGIKLSGGQRQRLAIARALLMEPDVLVLDEATSSLDSESEAAIQKCLCRLQRDGNVTVIIVAHRFSTLMHADSIIVLDKGHVVGQGSHEELLPSCDVYRTLYELQDFDAGRQRSNEAKDEVEPVGVGTASGNQVLRRRPRVKNHE